MLMLVGIGRKLGMTGPRIHSLMGVKSFPLFCCLCFFLLISSSVDLNICGE